MQPHERGTTSPRHPIHDLHETSLPLSDKHEHFDYFVDLVRLLQHSDYVDGRHVEHTVFHLLRRLETVKDFQWEQLQWQLSRALSADGTTLGVVDQRSSAAQSICRALEWIKRECARRHFDEGKVLVSAILLKMADDARTDPDALYYFRIHPGSHCISPPSPVRQADFIASHRTIFHSNPGRLSGYGQIALIRIQQIFTFLRDLQGPTWKTLSESFAPWDPAWSNGSIVVWIVNNMFAQWHGRRLTRQLVDEYEQAIGSVFVSRASTLLTA
ncbi:hypothetical protein JCM11491_005247 [Sporobolomyces phaffii]